MLSGTYYPTGWSQVSNILAHYLVPILVIIYTFTEKDFYLRDEITKIINAITGELKLEDN